ncbi:hypothetical protein HanIR_Chr10g0496161 [Helianthus annuus]|nr:hypothetical protein HanIR_Chr10g0496161 [Helianthus annuus]
MFIGASGFALSTFFSFSHAARSLRQALAFVNTSILYSVLNFSAKCWNKTSSKSLPPRQRSNE